MSPRMETKIKAYDLNASHLGKLFHQEGPKGISVTAMIVRITHRFDVGTRRRYAFVDVLVNGTEVEFSFEADESITLVEHA